MKADAALSLAMVDIEVQVMAVKMKLRGCWNDLGR
jgi:hypothetical protein